MNLWHFLPRAGALGTSARVLNEWLGMFVVPDRRSDRGRRGDQPTCGGALWNIGCEPVSSSVKGPTTPAGLEPSDCTFHRPHQEVDHVAAINKFNRPVGRERNYVMASAAPPTATCSAACLTCFNCFAPESSCPSGQTRTAFGSCPRRTSRKTC